MHKLLLLGLLTASASSSAEVSEELTYGHYEAKASPGRSLAEILNDSSPFRPQGKVFHSATGWNVDWQFQTRSLPDGKCRIVRVATHLSGHIDLPKLVDADAGIEARFDGYLRALRVHELGHFAIGKEAAVAVDRKLRALPVMPSCEALESTARDLGARILGEYEAKGNRYDVETGHGRTQGAWLGD